MVIPKGSLFVTSIGTEPIGDDAKVFGLYKTLCCIDKNYLMFKYIKEIGEENSPYNTRFADWLEEKGYIEKVKGLYEMNFSGYTGEFVNIKKDPFWEL